MTNQEILEKAIRLAIEGGWNPSRFKLPLNPAGLASVYLGEGVEKLIFNHEFCKALWGEDTELGTESICGVCEMDTVDYWPAWQYHLQAMVISDDPIKYLEANI